MFDRKDHLRQDRAALVGELQAAGASGPLHRSACRCPFHDDHNESGSIHQSKDGGWRFKCHGCPTSGDVFDLQARRTGQSVADILRELNTTYTSPRGIQKPMTATKPPGRGYATANAAAVQMDAGLTRDGYTRTQAYPYTTVDGVHVGLVLRYERASVNPDATKAEKTFRQTTLHEDGQWRNDGAGVEQWPLYRLPDVLGSLDAGAPAVLAEGEKAAEALRAAGLNGTTTCGGAGKANKTDLSPLAGMQVIVWPDNDRATKPKEIKGHEHAADLCARLLALTPPAVVRLVEVSDLPTKADAADLDKAQIMERIRATQASEPMKLRQSAKVGNEAGSGANSDAANADLLVRWHGEWLRWNATKGDWMAFTGTRWEKDLDGASMRAAKDTARRMGRESLDTGDLQQRKDRVTWALKSEQIERLRAMLAVAQSVKGMTVANASLDADPMLLNCTNGTLDLRTMNLRLHRPDDLLSKLCRAAYDPKATAPTWTAFLARIFKSKPDCIGYMQRLLGCCLAGDTREQVFPILNGEGANGKSTLLEAVAHVMGDYAGIADRSLLQKQIGATHPANLADLRGLRMAYLQEVDDVPMDLARMKSITGDGTLKAREMYGQFFEFHRSFTLIATTNTPPPLPDQTDAVWRRIQIVPFAERIPVEEQDQGLPAKLRAEADGILVWMADGCKAWQAEGLNPPASVKAASEAYRDDSDPTAEFFAELTPTSWGQRIPQAQLKKDYDRWAAFHGGHPLAPKKFKAYAKRHGWNEKKTNGDRLFEFTGQGK